MSSFHLLRLSVIMPMLVTLTSTRPCKHCYNFNDYNDIAEGHEELSSYLEYIQDAYHGNVDNGTGYRVAEWQQDMNVNPEELGSYIEGDILFPSGHARNGLRRNSVRWPNGVVPYMISPYFNAQQRKLIYEAMDDYHKYTCIRFKPYRGEENDYIRITAENNGCWSSAGRVGGWQNVNLQIPACLTKKGIIIHELMHAIGFLHEQNRYERDNFVSIQWSNIAIGYDRNFEKISKSLTDDFGIEYDYGSVMHYSSYAFSRNGQPTIVPKEPISFFNVTGGFPQGNTRVKIGQREGFSKKDIEKIRRMYKCNRNF